MDAHLGRARRPQPPGPALRVEGGTSKVNSCARPRQVASRSLIRAGSRAAVAAVVVVTIASLAACSNKVRTVSYVPLAPPPSPPATQNSVMQDTLASLRIASNTAPGYSADRFGSGWLNVAGTKCDAFNFVLERDLTNAVINSSADCVVGGGALFDPYSAVWTWYDATAAVPTLTIDHVVSLQDAWNAGASGWDDSQRALFANFPEELLATTIISARAKGSSTAASWLPANPPEWCEYAALQIKIKAEYALTVTQAEHDALSSVLQACPDSFTQPPATSPPPLPPKAWPFAATATPTAKPATNQVAVASPTPHATLSGKPSHTPKPTATQRLTGSPQPAKPSPPSASPAPPSSPTPSPTPNPPPPPPPPPPPTSDSPSPSVSDTTSVSPSDTTSVSPSDTTSVSPSDTTSVSPSDTTIVSPTPPIS
jgi:hypothetical protein